MPNSVQPPNSKTVPYDELRNLAELEAMLYFMESTQKWGGCHLVKEKCYPNIRQEGLL